MFVQEMMKQLMINQDRFHGQIGSKLTLIEGNVTALTKQVSMLDNQVRQMANQAA